MSSIAAMSLAFALGAAPQGNAPPVARAGADAQVECELDGAAAVSLDGTASSDPDSTPGTNDDIRKYRWTEGETRLAEAATASVHLTVGVHVVTLTVVDVAGAEGADEVTVVVYDDAPPVIACPKDVTVECAGPHGAEVVWGRASAKDTCFGTAVVVNDRTDGGTEAQGLYPPGETVVTFTATDAAGHTASCEAVVTVADTQSPSLQVVLAPTSLEPPNHALRQVAASVRAVDVCDPSPSVVLESALSSEPDDAPGGGDGATTNDIQGAAIGTGDFEVFLRAERTGNGPGRIYTLRYVAKDAAGNTTPASATVSVPH